jgi:glutaredoxin-like protein NrdH
MTIGLRTTRGTPLIRYAQGSGGVEPGMNLTNQVNKFNDRALRARQSGDHALADYFEHLRDLMVSDAQAGRPRPFKHYLPMAQEEFGDHIAKVAKKWDEPGSKCKYCKSPPTHAILHSEGMAYVQTCDKHLGKGKKAAEGCVPYGPPDPGNIIKIKKIAAEIRHKIPADENWLDEHETYEDPHPFMGVENPDVLDTTRSGKWYHVSPYDLPPGTRLVPRGGSSPGGEGEHSFYNYDRSRRNRPNYVWLSPNLNKARSWRNWAGGSQSHVYEVHPGDRPQPWNFNGMDGWVAPHATIKRKVVARMANVVLYTKPGCVQCDATHRHLTRNNVPFESVDVTRTPQALEHARSLGYSSAPVVITQDDHWSGYRPDKLDTLKTAGRPYTDEEMAVHKQQGWRGPPCEDPTHIGEVMGRCPDCGRRVAPEQKVAYWDEGPWHNVVWDEDLEDDEDEDEMPVLPPRRHRGR